MIRLNLLPSEVKVAEHQRLIWQQWRRALTIIAITTVVSVVGLELVHTAMVRRQADLQTQLSQAQSALSRGSAGSITRETQNINLLVKQLSELMGIPRSWATDLTIILRDLPAGVELSNLTLTADGSITLDGVASTRSVFLDLREKLMTDNHLTKVTTTSEAASRSNLPFSYTAQFVPQP